VHFLILLGGADHFDNWDAADDVLRARSFRDYNAFADAVRQRGNLLAGDALHRPETARTVQPGASRLVTEGPFAETVEQIGGFYLIDVPTSRRRSISPSCYHVSAWSKSGRRSG
jgi:hypothetical protein